MTWRSLTFAIGFLWLLRPQDAVGQVVHQLHGWVTLFGEYQIADRVSLSTELSLRRGESLSTWQQQVGALGLWYRLSPEWRVQGAAWFGRQFPYGARRGEPHEREARGFLALVGQRRLPGIRTVQWSDRWRVERRYRRAELPEAETTSGWRVRRQDRLTYVLREDWSVSVMHEWLIALPRTKRPALEQMRTQMLFGRVVRPGLRLETGYQLQQFPARIPREFNHTMLLFARHEADLR